MPILVVSGCATTKAEPEDKGWYDSLFDPDDRLVHLLMEGNLAEASRFHNQQKHYFASHKNASSRSLKTLANLLNERFTHLLQRSEKNLLSLPRWPAPPDDWEMFYNALKEAEGILGEYRNHSVLFSTVHFTSPAYTRLDQLAKFLRKRMVADAGDMFLHFGGTNPEVFLQLYPVLVSRSVLGLKTVFSAPDLSSEKRGVKTIPRSTHIFNLRQGLWKPDWPFGLSKKGYAIYFGSFRNPKTIQNLIHELGLQEDETIMYPVKVADISFFRLFLKPINNLERAQKVIDHARRMGSPAKMISNRLEPKPNNSVAKKLLKNIP